MSYHRSHRSLIFGGYWWNADGGVHVEHHPLINRSTSQKKRSSWQRLSYGMAMSFFSHPLAATSPWWTVRGLCWRILLNYVNWLRKKWISTLIYFILFFGLLPTRLPQNWSDHTPLMSQSCRPFFPTPQPSRPRVFSSLLCVVLRQSPPKTTIIFIYFLFFFCLMPPQLTWNHPSIRSAAVPSRHYTSPHHRFFLVGCCVSFHRLVAVYSHGVNFSFHFSLLESPKATGYSPSQTFRHGRILSRIPAPSLVLLSVGCCVVSANAGRLKLMPCPSLSMQCG